MNEVLLDLHGLIITPWKIVGYTGVALFGSRWFLQVHASHRAGRPVVPRVFWLASMAGSLMLLLYFVFGKNDSVGILSNLFPLFIAGYNLSLDFRGRAQDEILLPGSVEDDDAR